jgi:hypothetical protein
VEFVLLLTVLVGLVSLPEELTVDLLFSVNTLLFVVADFVAETLFLLLESALLTPELEVLLREELSVDAPFTVPSALLFRADEFPVAIAVEVLLVPSLLRKTFVPVDLLFPYS